VLLEIKQSIEQRMFMKSILFLAITLFGAFSVAHPNQQGICVLGQMTTDLLENPAVKVGQTIYAEENTRERLYSSELEMIQQSVAYTEGTQVTIDEAYEIFAPRSGYLIYFNHAGARYVIVTYAPGDNEYGLIFSTDHPAKVIAEVRDSELTCR
jgi:hypothetical protein